VSVTSVDYIGANVSNLDGMVHGIALRSEGSDLHSATESPCGVDAREYKERSALRTYNSDQVKERFGQKNVASR
jgi:hypothetical protein